MRNLDNYFGRLGNRMFQCAFLMQVAKEFSVDHYFQDPDWFRGVEKEVKELYSQDVEPNDYVGMHVRRGDYVGHPLYVDLTQTDYYEKAMKEFPNSKFLIFSDDIEWCKEYFEGDYEFCEEQDPIKAFNIMAGCKGLIMANSSFSWWAGYLLKGKVVAPKQWFSDGTSIKLLDVWQKI